MALRTREIVVCIGIGLCLIVALQIGRLADQDDVDSSLHDVLVSADQFIEISTHLYEGMVQKEHESHGAGWVSLGSAPGYAGPVETAVAWTSDLKIERIIIRRQTETKAFFRKLRIESLLKSLQGKACTDPFQVGQDIQAVTGATVSLQGLAESTRMACRTVCDHAGLPVAEPKHPVIFLGIPEVVLMLLYGIGFLAYVPRFRMRLWLRRLGLGLGLILLGCWLNRPVSLVQINALLLGYWPQWQTHVYWYLLVGGILLPILLTGRSVYCSHICPMGAVQETLGFASGKQFSIPGRITVWLRWFQRSLTLLAVVVALVSRNPVKVQYEITGTLFGLTGPVWQFALLALVLIGSLFLVRPWCLIFCPIRAVMDYLGLARRSVLGPQKPHSVSPKGGQKDSSLPS